MKVLHLVQNLDWGGGIETYLLSMLPHLEAEGHPQVVAYERGNPQLAPRAHHVPMVGDVARHAEAGTRDAVLRLLDQEGPDLAHLHNINNLGAIQACLENVPTFLTAHGYHSICPATDFFQERTLEICERSCGPSCFLVTLKKRCLTLRPKYAFGFYRRSRWTMERARRFAGIIAPSTYAAERYVRAGFPRDRVTVLPYYCPIEPVETPSAPPQVPTLLFLGRIRPYKGYQYFVEALGLLPPPIRGLMVGDFTARTTEAVHRLASTCGCSDRLELRPWIDRAGIADLMREATVFVFPSIWPETLGIVGLEALASGVPVVASDVGGVREWLRDGETGVLVPPKDPPAIAKAVKSILDSDDRREKMGRRGIALMRKRFSPESHRARLVALYERAGRTIPVGVS